MPKKARERCIQPEPQKRNGRAGAPPIKRWEWMLFYRLGAAASTTMADKVRAKIHDRPTGPKLAATRARFHNTRKNLNRAVGLLDRFSKDWGQPQYGPRVEQGSARWTYARP